jgi:hypothetical protein
VAGAGRAGEVVANYGDPGYLLRVSIAFDQLVQAACNRGILGITISARAGTAEAQTPPHKWGLWLSRLLDWMWPFGRDPLTGERHVVGAIRGDRWRAFYVLNSLWTYYPDAELITALKLLIESKQG